MLFMLSVHIQTTVIVTTIVMCYHVTTTDQDVFNDLLHQNNNANLPAIIFNVVNSDNNVY